MRAGGHDPVRGTGRVRGTRPERDDRRAPSSSDTPVTLEAALDRLARSLGIAPSGVLRRLCATWPHVVGEDLVGHVGLVGVERGRLRVVADTQAAATAVRLRRELLLDRAAAIGLVLDGLEVRVARK